MKFLRFALLLIAIDLVAAARADPATYGPILKRYFTRLDAYWDSKVEVPGYEAAPTRGNGDDKYYDDNAWLVITFLEAYETDQDPRYLTRADATLKFVLSGWDEECGGGIWWHQRHKDGTKNACSMLYAACWRATRALGYRRLGTYTLASEPGTSLKAAGWKELYRVQGRSWHCPTRPRVDRHPRFLGARGRAGRRGRQHAGR